MFVASQQQTKTPKKSFKASLGIKILNKVFILRGWFHDFIDKSEREKCFKFPFPPIASLQSLSLFFPFFTFRISACLQFSAFLSSLSYLSTFIIGKEDFEENLLWKTRWWVTALRQKKSCKATQNQHHQSERSHLTYFFEITRANC